MKRKLAIFLVLTLVFTLIYPAMGVILAEGGVGPDTTTIIVSNSKTVEDYGDAINVYEPDMHNVIGYYVHHVGYEYVDGLPTVTRTVLQFDLNSINPNRTIEKIELQYYQTHARPNSHMIIWGSNNYQWIESDQALPDKDVPIANEIVDRTGEERISYDVSAYVMSQLAGEENDKKATFLFEGATDPSDPNAPGIERYTSFSSKEDSDAGKHPRLVITYGANTPPSGNIVVEGNGYTGSRAVQLNITAVDPEGDAIEMNIYEGSPSDNWVEYQSRKEWILSDGDGEKTILMQLRDQHGSTSEVYSTKVTLDTVAPIARFTIYEGSREYTTTPLVTLQVSGEDDNPIESMRLSNQQGSWNNWIDFTESYPWTLEDASDGLKTVYLQLIDKAGNESEPVSQAIILDQTAPEGSIAINNNATHTNTTAVELTLEADDGDGIGRIQMRHSNDNQLWNQWGPFQEKLDWNLAEGDGQKTVYMELRDGAENESIVSASIYLDTTAPTGNVSINGGADYTNTEDVILTVEANDGDGIGSIEVQFSNDEQVWSEWIDFDSELENKVYVWQLAEGDGYKQVYIRLRDGLENESSSVIGSTIILDTIPPSISGVENGGLYNTEVKIEFNEGTATLNGSAFVSGATVSQEGSYELIVTDAAGNETKVQFTIDQTAPTFTGVVDGGIYKESVTIHYHDEVGPVEATLNGNAFESGAEVSEEGSHELIVTDAAGNETKVQFTIDQTAPTVTGVVNGGIYKDPVTIHYHDEVGPVEATLNGNALESGTEVREEGSHELIVTDAAGNETKVQFTIDQTAPTVTGVIDGGIYKGPVTIHYHDEVGPVEATLNGNALESGAEVSEEGSHELIVTDAAGNETKVQFTIDQTAPTVIGVIDGGIYKDPVTIHYHDEVGPVEATLNGNAFESGTEVSEEGSHELIVTDAAGNETKVQFTIDQTAPTVTGVIDGGIYKDPVTIHYQDEIGPVEATLNGNAFESGTEVSKEGSHELIVTDAAGNETKVQFTIDRTAPTGNLQINEEGSNYTNTLDVVLHFTGTDMGGSAFIETRFSNDLEEWKDDWERIEANVEENMPWTLKNDNNSEKVVYMQLRDEAGNVSTISATITYKSIPIPAEEHTVRGEEDQNLKVQKSDFNYENTDGTDIYSIKIVTLPEHGELTFGNEIVKSGQEILMSELEQYALTFTPEQDWYGSTELVWKAGNGFEFSDIAGKLLLELSPVNDAPVAKDIKLSSVAGETIVGQLEAYDIDNDLEDLRYKLVSEPTGGTLRIFDEESGAFEYVTNKGEHGTFTFTYQAFDGELFSNEATVEIEVRRLIIDPPPTPPIPEPPSTNPPVIPKEEEIPKEEANVKVEGASQQVLRIGTSQRNGLSVLHVGFNEKLFMEALEFGSNRLSLQIVDELDVIETELSEEQIEFLAQHSLDIELVTSGVTYLLPVQNIGFDSIISEWGLGQTEQDYKLRFRVTAATQATQDIINLEAQRQNFEVIHLPVSFNLLLVYDEKEYPIYKLDKIIPELVSWSVPEHPTSTAAVVALSDGTIAPLPTKFNRSSGKASVSVSGMLLGDIALVQMNRSFTDIDGHWAKGAVENLASKLILNGKDNERFAPNDKVNRAEFTAILARGLGLWTEQEHADFADLKKDVWYDKPLQAVIEAGLVEGYDDQTFKPQQEITREEAAVIFARALKLLGKDVSLTEQEIESILIVFTDKESIKSWSREAIALSIRTGLISKDQQALLPNESLTRAQLAVMFDRLLRLL